MASLILISMVANISGGGVPRPRQWWAFYVPAAVFAAMGLAFWYGDRSTPTSRVPEFLLLGFAVAWFAGAVRYTVKHFRRAAREE